jgi:hypothetical protein
MKLLHSKHISEAQAIGELDHIRAIDRFNKTYLAMADGMLNQFSVFVQALGRIDRVWKPTENQLVRLDKEVYSVFERFMSQEDFAFERQNFLRFASSSVRSLLTTLEKYAPQHRDAVEDELLDIGRANQQARHAIHRMVMDIQQFRRTGKPTDVRERWLKLREDVLKHNLQADSLKLIGGVFHTSYATQGELYMNEKGQVAPPAVHSHEFKLWNPNGVYRPLTVIRNTSLTNYFRVRGYELAFLDSGSFLLPYVHQAILTGAVGEEATQAILKMKGIQASGDTIPNELFEVADLRVEGRPIFIDAKNYGTRTLRQFALPPDDPLHRPTLNEPYFKERLIDKWQTIREFFDSVADEPCRLIVINLLHDEEAALRYYDNVFGQVDSWEEGRIIVLTGALKTHPSDPKDLLTLACNTLLTNLQ